jgi:hypothetical protein
MIENILRMYESASPTDLSEGRGWYQYARYQCSILSEDSGIEIRRVVYAVAALSPMLKWEKNIAAARAVINGARKVPGVFDINVEKALHILYDETDWERWLSGNKVRSFAANILGDEDAATIDTWMWRVWAGADLQAAPPALDKVYWQIAADYREAARLVGLTTRELQAVVWVAARRLVAGRSGWGQLSLEI